MKTFPALVLILCGLFNPIRGQTASFPSTDPDAASPGNEATLLPRSLGGPSVGVKELGSFASIAILHEGRVKPLETFSRNLLLQWSGQSRHQGRAALSVLAGILFTPEKTGDLKLFRIDNPEAAEALRIAPEPRRRYSYRQIEPALRQLQILAARADSMEDSKRNPVEKELIRTMANVVAYLDLTRAMQYALPSPALAIRHPETWTALNLSADGNPPTFWELMDKAPLLAKLLEDAMGRSQPGRSPVTDEVIRLSRIMYLESQASRTSLLNILPDTGKSRAWSSPAEVIAEPMRLHYLRGEIGALASMASAYRKGDAGEFQRQAVAFNKGIEYHSHQQLKKTRFGLEILYDRLDPIFLATVAYWIALLFCFLYFLRPRRGLYAAGWLAAMIGISIQLASIVARIFIMRRPPVTSLFETFPFVAAVAVALALFLERRSRQSVALLCAALLGAALLSIAGRYASDGDTMQMLAAVLNSNFWLSTHVICITMGYAACILCGAIGHMRLIRSVFPGKTPDVLREIDRMVYGTLCFGLLFSFLGTVLGGIWADQSWGRFWGWDPKENGALLIVLWCAILLHARQSGVIRQQGMAVGSVIGAIIVSLAWLGVNLLNVGLHSYGFTTGAAVKLFSYIGAEILFLILIAIGLAWRGRRAA